jgi:hypothetical protein
MKSRRLIQSGKPDSAQPLPARTAEDGLKAYWTKKKAAKKK